MSLNLKFPFVIQGRASYVYRNHLREPRTELVRNDNDNDKQEAEENNILGISYVF